ncbi:PREDICTED: LOW QUALITY PROTEIN: uncharacterized protein LOC104810422 [Tarenaya hassleriana]|uniref:LOW QUALITY PROTEIN: uncharacterized protein LOC104810422 n=1 Tax=Tarenaya hassleriana TaxID=28532 RepID=UPI0008FD0B69|nr:PREDICTED: LOW QUALITY PROTEIN: uncharacterized protein LOC104810422 [Tarenaya hassleriana]
MLLEVEGGHFFLSLSSGCSNGLTLLLLLGVKDASRPMSVAPWNQFQLVDREAVSALQLASFENRLSHGCASVRCFGRASAGLDSPSPLKVGPSQHQDIAPKSFVADESKDHTSEADNSKEARKLSLRSSLKRPSATESPPLEHIKEYKTWDAHDCNLASNMERRKVQWTDTCGKELTEVREFEPSEMGLSDEELEKGIQKTCSCVIM